MLIVIDGSDGSGKKTQAALLKERLEKEGHAVETLDFPQYNSFFGELISNYLLGSFGSKESINPKLVSLLYALDRFGSSDKIKKWIDEKKIVVLDRYAESNMAYQAAKLPDESQDEIITWLEELEFNQLKIPKADLILFLHVPSEISAKLIESRPDKEYLKGKRKDIHEADADYMKKVEKTYLSLTEKKGWVKIECSENQKILSKEKISELIWEKVSTLLH